MLLSFKEWLGVAVKPDPVFFVLSGTLGIGADVVNADPEDLVLSVLWTGVI
jgi:hypothetical protein